MPGSMRRETSRLWRAVKNERARLCWIIVECAIIAGRRMLYCRLKVAVVHALPLSASCYVKASYDRLIACHDPIKMIIQRLREKETRSMRFIRAVTAVLAAMVLISLT